MSTLNFVDVPRLQLQDQRRLEFAHPRDDKQQYDLAPAERQAVKWTSALAYQQHPNCNVCEYYTNRCRCTRPVLVISWPSSSSVSSLTKLPLLPDRGPAFQSVCKLDCPNKTAQLQHARSLRQLWSNWPNFNGAAAVAPSTEISVELRHLFAVTSSGDSIVYDEGNGPTGSDPFHLHFFTRCAMRSDRINCCADGQCDTVVLWRSPQVYSRIVKRDEEKNNIKRNGSAIFLKS